MNFSLHLQTIFTFVRQNNFKEKNPIHKYKNCTRHCLFMHLNSTTVDLVLAERCTGNSPCTYTYIHISRAMKLSGVTKTSFFCLFHVVIFPSCAKSGRSAPPSTAPSQPLCSSASVLYLQDATLGGEDQHMDASMYQECLCCIHLYS